MIDQVQESYFDRCKPSTFVPATACAHCAEGIGSLMMEVGGVEPVAITCYACGRITRYLRELPPDPAQIAAALMGGTL